jgi:hypothetical protein
MGMAWAGDGHKITQPTNNNKDVRTSKPHVLLTYRQPDCPLARGAPHKPISAIHLSLYRLRLQCLDMHDFQRPLRFGHLAFRLGNAIYDNIGSSDLVLKCHLVCG